MDIPTVYCEYINGALHQPINVLSSFALILAALFAFWHNKKYILRNRQVVILPILLGFAGLGSMAWHFTNQPWGDFLDTIAIVLFGVAAAYLLFEKIFNKRWQVYTVMVTFLAIALFLEQIPALNGSLPYVFLYLTLIGTLSLRRKKYKEINKPTLLIALYFALAIMFRSIDVAVCNYVSIGSHFLWHALVALTGYYLISVIIKLRSAAR